MRDALFWHSIDGRVQCELCPHLCRIAPGKRGICGIRENRDGKLQTLTYGRPVSLAIDPVEKKPLFHVHPGSTIYSVGMAGCNLKCVFCQNYSISQALPEDLDSYEAPPDVLVRKAEESGCLGIAFTYNEPVISAEYALDTFRLAHEKGLYTCLVTNGYVSADPARHLAEHLDCANVDLKSSEAEFYRRLCKAPHLEAVKEAMRIWNAEGVALEITNLLIPGHNDAPGVVDGVIDFVLELGSETPLHFSRFHPTYLLRDVDPTPQATLERAVHRAKEKGLRYVYAGNVFGSEYEHTYCPSCSSIVIERHGFLVGKTSLDANNHCSKCGEPIRLLGRPAKGRTRAFL